MAKILIANRGEIALRILRAAKEMGHQTVAVYSKADVDLMHLRLADEAICIGPAPSLQSYLDPVAIISAAEVAGVDAIHPGYGFLSEHAEFAEQVENSGFIFMGPTADTIRTMGDKVRAIDTMKAAGLQCIPGSDGVLDMDMARNQQLAESIGYPVLLKASAGGGGRGQKIVYDASELEEAIISTTAEAQAMFKNPDLFMEKFLVNPRHIEFQVLGDGQGHVVCLGDRDCSMQRRHQKMLEEAQAPGLSAEQRQTMIDLCIDVCQKINYRGAGTLEFLYAEGQFYFIEMNARIQVEHPVTEMVTNEDLVKHQIAIALDKKLNLQQQDIVFSGHAIECRINAEDPVTFMPAPGKITAFHAPGGIGVRFDSHIYTHYRVPHYYDSMIGKLICHAPTREQAIIKMQTALDELIIEGIKTNIPAQRKILADPVFKEGSMHTNHVATLLA